MRTLWLCKACYPETKPTVEWEQEEACGIEERRKRKIGRERGSGG